MWNFVLVGLGGAIGAMLRYGLGGLVRRLEPTFPWDTLVVNLSGCLAIGFLSELLLSRAAPPEVRNFVLVGILGGYTTFSSFGLETIRLLQDKEFGLATLNVLASNVAGIVLVFAGVFLARWVIGMAR